MSQGSSIPPVPPGGAKPAGNTGQVVQIVSLPEGLQTVSRAVRIEGEVIQQNKDGSVRVRTEQGDIDITVRGRQPQAGQKIEVDIPAGSPPKTATIRTAPVPAPLPQVPTQNTPPPPTIPLPLPQTPVTGQPGQVPPPASAPVPATPQPLPNGTMPPPVTDPAKPQAAPLPTTYHPSAENAATIKPALPPVLAAGQIVQLTPITQPQAQTIIQQMMAAAISPDISIAPQPGTVPLQAAVIAQNAPSDLQNALMSIKPASVPLPSLQTGPQAPPSSPVTTAPPMPQNAAGIVPVPGAIGGIETIISDPAALRLLQVEAKITAIKLPESMATTTGTTATPMKGAAQIILQPSTPAADGGVAKPITITATIIGFTPQSTPVVTVQWPGAAQPQAYIMQTAAPNLVQGTEITLVPQTNAASVTLPTPTGLKPLMPLTQALSLWPVADDVYQAFFQATPAAAQIFGRIIPSPANPSNFGPAALLFIAAAKAGDLQNWVGEKKLEMLQKLGKQGLVSRLSGDMAQAATANADNSGADWRSYPIPLLWQNEISKVMLHLHHEQPQSEGDNSEGGTRFIMDLDLERMGEVQLDGLLRGHRLDLIVRTKEAISYPMQQAMTKAYADALAGTDVYGEIAFQGDLKGWMNVVVTRAEKLGVSA